LYSVKDEYGKIEYVVNTYMDITEVKHAEEDARKQQEIIARTGRTTRMGQLTGSIAHELNQPLTGILSNAQAAELMIKSGKWNDEGLMEIIKDIIIDTKRGGAVIRNLRESFREQKGEFLPVDVNDIVNKTTHFLRSEFVTQQVILTKTCASSIPKVNGNWIQLQQVLVNLIMNGLEAMQDTKQNDRKLLITTAHHADEVNVWVEDCGTGIKADRIDKIFELLETWKPGGTGMGLAICNSIIEAHDGKMSVENRSEGGARVGFVLPVLKEGGKT
jgi:C4-dicarboxylate-specific signal transduction histidine kinase